MMLLPIDNIKRIMKPHVYENSLLNNTFSSSANTTFGIVEPAILDFKVLCGKTSVFLVTGL